MKKFIFIFLLFSFFCFADESLIEIQYKKEIENAKKLQEVFNFDTWKNVKFKKKDNSIVKSFQEFNEFEKHIYILIVAENTSRMLAGLEKSWKDKIKSNENFDNLNNYIVDLHEQRKMFFNKYLNYVQNLNAKFEKELTNEEMNLIIKQIKDFSKKENLD